jgi:uncharacterized protein (DUF305 family)
MFMKTSVTWRRISDRMTGPAAPAAGSLRATVVVASVVASLVAIAASVVPPTMSAQSGPNAGPASHAGAAATADTGRPETSAADVHFMQGMIGHHAQALTMVSLIASRTARPDMPLLGQRIAISQRDEIRLMQRWLSDHHEDAPAVDTIYTPGGHAMMPGMMMAGALMPGMLTDPQMDELAKAKGADFDRLFLTGMIRHHEGALTMVSQLLATNGAAQDPAIFGFASDVDADQRAEIKRMRGMLGAAATGERRQ